MSDQKQTDTDRFLERLQHLRMKIDSLPEAHRPHLYELADTIRKQYDQQHQNRKQAHGFFHSKIS